MPFSFFAARCLYVAKQPLKFRQDVIRRILTARVVSHTTLVTAVAGNQIINAFPIL